MASAEAMTAAFAGLPAVIEAVGNQKTTMSARIDGIGAVSVTAGELMDGAWGKNITDAGIEEKSMRRGVTENFLSAITGAKNAAQARAISHFVGSTDVSNIGEEDTYRNVSAIRELGGHYDPRIGYQNSGAISMTPDDLSDGSMVMARKTRVARPRRVVPRVVEEESSDEDEWEEVQTRKKTEPQFAKGTKVKRVVSSPQRETFRRPGPPPAESVRGD